MKQRFIIIFILGIIFGFTNIRQGYCWSPIVKSPEIHGRVMDATTKQPIQSALVTVAYYKEVLALVDRRSAVFASYEYLTDKDGRFTVPAKTSFHMPPLFIVGSWFAGRNVMVFHPLHITAPEISSSLEKSEIVVTTNKDGSLDYEVYLLSLEKKYIKGIKEIIMENRNNTVKGEQLKKLEGSFYGFLGSYESAYYWLVLKQHQKNYNPENTFLIWDNIVEDILQALNWNKGGSLDGRLEKVKNNIRGNLKK